jgi:hypothetical protein
MLLLEPCQGASGLVGGTGFLMRYCDFQRLDLTMVAIYLKFRPK